LKIGPNFFLQLFKNKIIFNFVKFVATKKGLTKNFFSPLSFVAVFRSGIRNPGSGMGKNQDPGSGINIPDPHHCDKSLHLFQFLFVVIHTFSLSKTPGLEDKPLWSLINRIFFAPFCNNNYITLSEGYLSACKNENERRGIGAHCALRVEVRRGRIGRAAPGLSEVIGQ
jgi:hypothetical protein